jgi:uncharacterized protein (TIGR03435 family)
MSIIRPLCVILLISGLVFAQTSFEVASIKPVELNIQAMAALLASGKLHLGMNIDEARVDIGLMSLGELIPIAFKVKAHQVAGPDWMKDRRFDIIAKLPDGATKEQVPEMLQSLLAERFQLKTHRENREIPVYALVVAKGGPKLKESTEADAPAAVPGAIAISNGQNQFQVSGDRGGGATIVSSQTGTMKIGRGSEGQIRMEMGRVSMNGFAEMLNRFVDRPVVDMTELKGTYEVALDVSQETMLAVARASGIGNAVLAGRGADSGRVTASDPSSNSVFASVQQLGLRLEPRKNPTEVIVVDHLEKMPTEN